MNALETVEPDLRPALLKRFQLVCEIYHEIRRETGEDYRFQFPSIKRLATALDHFDGALDASDTGTGKTAVACAVAKVLGRDLFVICPKNVMAPWRRMAARFEVRCGVINYEMLRTGHTPFGGWQEPVGRQRKPRFVFRNLEASGLLFVFDECHRMKDYKTKNCAMGIASIEAGHKTLALSATAADNPMHMKFIALLTGLIDKPYHFWGWMLAHGVKQGRFGYFFAGGRPTLSRIHHQIFPLRGSRIRIAELGDRFPQTQIISESYEMEVGDEIERIYQQMQREINELMARKASDWKANVLTAQLRARQEVELLKVPTLVQMAQDGLEEGLSVVVILNFSASITAEHWRKNLKARASNQITGAIDSDMRQELIDAFNADQEDFLLMNIKAGGLGISLHGTSRSRTRLVLISPTFSGIDLKQALGRCHRAGGAHSIQKIVWAAGTVEERACAKVRARLQRVSIFNDDQLDEALAI